MRIDYLITDNFRNFYGPDNRIDFSSGERSVTVIHGKNGSGKSTILNAFTWALYGSLTKSIKNKKKIIVLAVGSHKIYNFNFQGFTFFFLANSLSSIASIIESFEI